MLTVVIPTWNEAANLGAVLDGLRSCGARVIVVDDGSPDGTAALARKLGAEVLSGSGKAGLGRAYLRGFAHALGSGADPIVQMDGDGSHAPTDVPRLLAALDGADLALGSRYVTGGGTRNWAWHRRLLSRFGTRYAATWLGLPYRDLTGGFKAWRADLLRSLDLETVASEGYAFQVEMTWRAARAGARVAEIPIVFTERAFGTSKMSAKIAWEAAFRVPSLRLRDRP